MSEDRHHSLSKSLEAAASGRTSPAEWAAMPVDRLCAALDTGLSGLTGAQARDRLAAEGPNVLPRVTQRHWSVELAAQFVHLFALLLWVGAALAWIAGIPELSAAIVAVVVVNGIFSYWQEYQAERSAEALEKLLPHHATVRRDGRIAQIPASEVVRGDLLVLGEGDSIPADARLVLAERLKVDMSSVTGESRPVPRSATCPGSASAEIGSLQNMIFAGTSVTGGRGEAIVHATGARTEFGRIAELSQAQDSRRSPLQIELAHVTRVVTVLSIGFGVVFFAAGTLVGKLSVAASFVFALGIIVANVPEGLLPTLTLSLAMGVRRMAARRALVKRLSAVETLGATTVILTDKTGTITENEMTVCEAWCGRSAYRITGAGYNLTGTIEPLERETPPVQDGLFEMVRAAALCCDARLVASEDGRGHCSVIGDPTEAAILVAASKAGVRETEMSAWPRVAELPFDSVRKRMSTVHRIDGASVACVKGASGEVLSRCTQVLTPEGAVVFDAAQMSEVLAAHDRMARRGLRVLAVAERDVSTLVREGVELDVDDVERDLMFLGLLGMEDPPRPEVAAALEACRTAGIRVAMVTGDNELTAAAIGREVGMYEVEPRVVTGAELEKADDEALAGIVTDPAVLFARVSPEHKLRLVIALQRQGEVVAVTGDGVNDAPALKRADIGVAMGATGTDVAREAADMVLADDNFASIVAAVAEGRAVYDNVRKFVTYIFASNVPEMIPFVLYVLLRIPLPLTVMQVLAVDVGTDLVPALALGLEPPEPNVMKRPPHSRSERLLNRRTLLRAYAWLGAIEAALAIAAYFAADWLAGWQPGHSLPEAGLDYTTATTVCFAAIVMSQMGNLFACRSDVRSGLAGGLRANPMLLTGLAAELGILLILVYVDPIAAVFGLSPLRLEHWALLALCGPALFVLEELRKRAFGNWGQACSRAGSSVSSGAADGRSQTV